MGVIWGNVRYALRSLLRAPGFTLLAVGTLAVGVGANAAVFSAVDAVLFRDLPYREADRLVSVHTGARGDASEATEGVSLPLARDLGSEPSLFAALAIWRPWHPTLEGEDVPERVSAADVGYEMFSAVLGVRPALGRDFLPADEVEGGQGVVLLSDGTWKSRFGSDPEIVGKTLSLSGMPYVIVGVLPAGLRPPFVPDAELWRALGSSPALACARGCSELGVLGRLVGGVTVARARSQAEALGARLAESYPTTSGDRILSVEQLRSVLVRARAPALWTLFGAVGFGLLIACANVAGLLVARGGARRTEMAVRVALGAGRGAIMTQILTESLVLASLGGLAGLGVAAWGTDALLALAPAGTLPEGFQVAVDGRVLAFTAGLAALTGIGFGLLPAWRLGRRPVAPGLRRATARGSAGRGGAALASTQVAVAMVLCVGAGLLVRSFQRLRDVDVGFDPRGVMTVDLDLGAGRNAAPWMERTFPPALLERVRALPGVRAAGIGSVPPLSGEGDVVTARIDGPSPDPEGTFQAPLRIVSDGYMEALGVEVLSGRPFAPDDDPGNPRVVVVNQTLARRYFPEGDAVGRRIGWGPPEQPTWRRIVGVVRDIRQEGLRTPVVPAVYAPLAQEPVARISLVLAGQGQETGLTRAVRGAIAELDPMLAPTKVTRLDEEVNARLEPDWFAARVLGAFGLAALLLAALGIYVVVAQGVLRRARELGVRVALGADDAEVRGMVLRGALAVAGAGMAVGVTIAMVLGRFAGRFLFEVRPYDPITLGVSMVVLGTVAALAGWLPARRAAAADPMVALAKD